MTRKESDEREIRKEFRIIIKKTLKHKRRSCSPAPKIGNSIHISAAYCLPFAALHSNVYWMMPRIDERTKAKLEMTTKTSKARF